MIQIPDNFPSYTSYSPKTLIQHVDQLKSICRELQDKVARLEALEKTPHSAPATKKKEAANG